MAIWDILYGNGTPSSDFVIELADIKVNNSMYFFLTLNNTHFTLTTIGWYRVFIRLLWEGIASGYLYWLRIYKNDANLETLARHYGAASETFFQVYTFAYIFSDGDDVFHLSCYSNSDPFDIYNGQSHNQFAIEYMGVI